MPAGTGTAESQPPWFASTVPFPIEQTRHRAPRLPLDPLLLPRATRGIVSAVAATEVAEGEIDLERVVAAIATGELARELFRRKSFTVRNGLQLLIDRSESMTLFGRDCAWLEWQIERIVGRQSLESLRFSDLPQRGAGARGADWNDYRPPRPGIPVLVLSDLGIGASPAGPLPSEWLAFAETVKAAGCPLVVLVPYGKDRWPPVLTRSMALLHWDRTLVARAARAAARRAQRVFS